MRCFLPLSTTGRNGGLGGIELMISVSSLGHGRGCSLGLANAFIVGFILEEPGFIEIMRVTSN